MANYPSGLLVAPSERRDLPTRDRLIYAAEWLFLARGYQHVGLAEICTHAEALKGSLYNYFPTKSDLAMAVIDDVEIGLRDLLDRHERAARGPVNKLRATASVVDEVQSALTTTFRRKVGEPLGTMASELMVAEPRVAVRAGDALERWRERIAGHCHDIHEVGLLTAGTDPDELARLIMATMQGVLLMSRIDKLAHSIPEVSVAIERVIENAVQKR